jgi:membrane protein DedA with SNARE-associated domain
MTELLLAQSGALTYVLLFAMLLGGALGLPIPEDLPLLASGVLIHQDTIRWDVAFAVCYSGILLGDIFIFYIGRKFGPALFNQKWFKSKITNRRIKKMRVNLERRSFLMIFCARHLFYMRTITFLTAGAVKMRFGNFLAADAAAALVSAPLMMWLGYIFSENYHFVLDAISKAKTYSIIGGVILLCVGVVLYIRHKRREAMETEEAEGE